MPGTVFLEGERVSLNTVCRDDYSFIEEQHNDPSNRKQAGISLPWDEATVTEIVEDRDDVFILLACDDEDAVGIVILSELDTQARTAELGYILQPDEHGKGYATDAVELCLNHAFDDRGLYRLWAQVLDSNDASKRVLEKTGFQQEGVLREHEYANGERVDVSIYGLLSPER